MCLSAPSARTPTRINPVYGMAQATYASCPLACCPRHARAIASVSKKPRARLERAEPTDRMRIFQGSKYVEATMAEGTRIGWLFAV
jgi:hypothetical protein